jgi:RES domain-containing protein
VHRQTGVEIPCLPPARPAPAAGRYHRAGEPWPLYSSLDPTTAWAEWRAATGGALDAAAERRRLWRVDVTDLGVIDLRRSEARAALGVELADLIGPREKCQAAARRAQALGADGMIVPSAARTDAWNLVVFPKGFGAVKPAGSTVRNPAPPPAR